MSGLTLSVISLVGTIVIYELRNAEGKIVKRGAQRIYRTSADAKPKPARKRKEK